MLQRRASPLDRLLRLLLGAHEQDVLAGEHTLAHGLVRFLDRDDGLLQIDDVDAVALGEDVPRHARIPALGLMSEVDTRLPSRFFMVTTAN